MYYYYGLSKNEVDNMGIKCIYSLISKVDRRQREHLGLPYADEEEAEIENVNSGEKEIEYPQSQTIQRTGNGNEAVRKTKNRSHRNRNYNQGDNVFRSDNPNDTINFFMGLGAKFEK